MGLLLGQLDLFQFTVPDIEGDFSAVLPDHDRLISHAAGEIEGLLRLAAQGHPFGVLRDALLDGLPDFLGHIEEAIRRHGVVDPLMGALEVVVAVDPEAQPVPEVVDRSGDHPTEELVLEVLPERLHLAQSLGVVRAGDHVVDPFAQELLLEGALSPPGIELTALVAEDFLRVAVLPDGVPEDFQHLRAALSRIETPSHDVSGVVVHEGDQIHLLALGHGPHRDVDLPELVGFRSLEATNDFSALPFPGLGGDEVRLFQGL
jgi:hypothetical protein